MSTEIRDYDSAHDVNENGGFDYTNVSHTLGPVHSASSPPPFQS